MKSFASKNVEIFAEKIRGDPCFTLRRKMMLVPKKKKSPVRMKRLEARTR
jgi:hypothetical protein